MMWRLRWWIAGFGHREHCGHRYGYVCSCSPEEFPDGWRGFDTPAHALAADIALWCNAEVDGDDLNNALLYAGLRLVPTQEAP